MEEEKIIIENGEEKDLIEEVKAKYINPKKGRFKPIRIITGVMFAIVTAFMLYLLIAALTDANPQLAIGLGFTLGLIVYGGPGYIACEIPAILGLILTCVKRPNGLRKGQLAYFIIFVILPVACWFLFLLLAKILTK